MESISTLLNLFFFFNDTATTEIYTLSLHDALPISRCADRCARACGVEFVRRQPLERNRGRELRRAGPRDRRKPESIPRRAPVNAEPHPVLLGSPSGIFQNSARTPVDSAGRSPSFRRCVPRGDIRLPSSGDTWPAWARSCATTCRKPAWQSLRLPRAG